MNLQNGYKVIYEKAADGKRTFYASKTGKCDPSVDDQIGDIFVDADYRGKLVYEHKGDFYVAEGSTPTYDELGVPTDERLAEFDLVFKAAVEPATASVEDELNNGSTPDNDPSGDENLDEDPEEDE